MKWVYELRKLTKNEDMRQSLQRIECTFDDVSQVNLIDNAIKQPPHGPNDDGQYVDASYDVDLSRGNINQLLEWSEEQLPCPQRLTDPTELPLSRESIGMDLSWRSTESSTQNVHSSSILLCLVLVVVSILIEQLLRH